MKYYTETISVDLAEKLKETGMPIRYEFIPNYLGDPEGEARTVIAPPDYGFVFDWLMEKGIHFRIESDWNIETQIVTELATSFYIEKVGMIPIYVDIQDWHEAANKAIEKAIEMIKQ